MRYLVLFLFPVALWSQTASPGGSLLGKFVESEDARLALEKARPRDGETVERERLESQAPVPIPIQDAPLSAALQLIATAAGMNFVAPDPTEFAEPVSVSARIQPWRLLQLLSERYRFSLRFRDGLWFFERRQQEKPEAKTYPLRHANLDTYKASQNAFGLLGADPVSGRNGGQGTNDSGGLVFTPQTQRVVEDLKDLIGLSTHGGDGASAKAAAGAEPRGSVLYLPDTNSLFVITTPSRHALVAEYLGLVDRPARQIRIEARFFETTRDPKLVLGIDPSGYQPGIGLSGIETHVDLGRLRATPFPEKVLLQADAIRLQFNALQTDESTKLVNQPSVVVANNREAYFSVGDEEPFVSSNSISGGAAESVFGTSQAHVAIRRIGTSVNLVPTFFPGDGEHPARIRLAVRIEVGVLKGFRRINEADVPVVSSQKYEYTVFVRPGETLAFGGLSGMAEGETVKKVPLAGDIPLLGAAFRHKDKRASQRNLVAYLTATLVEENTGATATKDGHQEKAR